MRCALVLPLIVAAVAPGCGTDWGDRREKTLSTLNTEADRWDGGKEFVTTASDAYGRPVTGRVEKTTFNYALEVRSYGPDGLPKNSDDIVVTRTKSHGETSIAAETEKAAEHAGRGVATGIIQGIKKEFGRDAGKAKD